MDSARLAKAIPLFLTAIVACVGVTPDPPNAETSIPATGAVEAPAFIERPTPATTHITQAQRPELVPIDRIIEDFSPRILAIDAALAPTVASSWRADCPVPLEALRLLQVRYWDLNEQPAIGWLVVHSDVAEDVGSVFEELYSVRFPIERIQLVDVYGNDDDRSMGANNTSAFNCRTVGGSSTWSEHAFGRAVDINPLLNPFVTSSGEVFPPEGEQFIDRTLVVPGLITGDGAVVEAFASIGWKWGGNWSGSKDYQHFSETGR